MSQSFNQLLSQLLRGIEIDLGSTALCILVLEALYAAISDLKDKDLHHFFGQIQELTEDIENTTPRYAIIIDSFYEVLELAFKEDMLHQKSTCPLKKRKFLKCLKDLIRSKQQEKKAVTKQCEKIKIKGKTILLYNHSRTVEQALVHAKNQGSNFSVIVAEQDPDKTGEVIEFLHRKNIPFRVVPSYMIAHLGDDIDMFLLGALTLKCTMDFVTDTGTEALASQFHLKKIPIHMLIASSKFSLWESEKKEEIYSHVHRRKHHLKDIDFERIKFSHDRVPTKLLTKIITETGVYTPKQIEKLYKAKLAKRAKLEKRVELLS